VLSSHISGLSVTLFGLTRSHSHSLYLSPLVVVLFSFHTAVECHASHVHVHGELGGGKTHHYKLHWEKEAQSEPFSLIGRPLQDSSWVKTVLIDDPENVVILAGKGEGFKMNIRELSVEETLAQLK
jgi:hypothetical protein